MSVIPIIISIPPGSVSGYGAAVIGGVLVVFLLIAVVLLILEWFK